jgi:hypothetical protein
VRRLNECGLRIVLALDDFEYLSNNGNLDLAFFNALRAAAGRFSLVFLTASVRPLLDLTFAVRSQNLLSSPFFNIFALRWLGALDELEARRVIGALARPVDTAVSPEIEDYLYALAGGYPLALYSACRHTAETPGDWAEIERRTVNDVRDFLWSAWCHLSPAEQAAARSVGDPPISEAANRHARHVLRTLVQKGVLAEDGPSYRYASRVWACFIDEHSRR